MIRSLLGWAILAWAMTLPALAEPVRTPPGVDPVRGCDKPHYPMVSRRMGEQGAVVLRFLVAPDGSIQKGEVVNSSGFERLDQAALDSLAQCRFNPATIDGKPDPQPAWAMIRYAWKLEGEGDGAAPVPGDHSWYTVAANKDVMILVDENSASSKDGVVNFIQSQIFYTMPVVKEIGDASVRRFDSLDKIDCAKNLWAVASLAFINDANQVISVSAPPGDPQWVPIAANSWQAAEHDLLCLGHYNSMLVRKDKDIHAVQLTYLNAAKAFQ